MKVHREETKFQPVVITLETQEEVHEMMALLVHIDLCGEGTALDGAWECLDPHAEGYEEAFGRLEERMKKAYPRSRK